MRYYYKIFYKNVPLHISKAKIYIYTSVRGMTRRHPSDERALVIIPQRGGKRATFLKRGLQKAFRFTRFHASSRTRLPNIRSKMSSIEDNLLDNGRERGSLESKLIKGACRRRRGLSSERRRGKKAGEGKGRKRRVEKDRGQVKFE